MRTEVKIAIPFLQDPERLAKGVGEGLEDCAKTLIDDMRHNAHSASDPVPTDIEDVSYYESGKMPVFTRELYWSLNYVFGGDNEVIVYSDAPYAAGLEGVSGASIDKDSAKYKEWERVRSEQVGETIYRGERVTPHPFMLPAAERTAEMLPELVLGKILLHAKK